MLLDEGICHITRTGVDRSNLVIALDRKKLESKGVEIIGSLLLKMHTYLCTADRTGVELYDSLSVVSNEMEEYRSIVERSAGKHKQIVQASTFLGDDGIPWVREYEPSPSGMIRSWAERGL